MNRLSIVILNYNTKNLTLRAVRSAVEKTTNDTTVVVVDNASTDGSVQVLEELSKTTNRLSITTLPKNIGFAGGNNVALRTITSTYIMLLNSDATIDTGSVADALDFMDQYQDIGILAPYIRLPSGAIDPACHRGFPTPWNAFCYFSGLERLCAPIPVLNRLTGGYHQIWKRARTFHDIDACSGAAMIVRKSALDEVGLLDEQFFMYGEDLDWCYRFRMHEWRILFYPELTIMHTKHSSGIKPTSSEARAAKQVTRAAFFDAMELFFRKHHRGPTWIDTPVRIAIRLMKYNALRS